MNASIETLQKSSRGWPAAAWCAVLLAVPADALARGGEPEATLLGRYADRAVVAFADSGTVEIGRRVRFADGRRLVAAGDVIAVADGRLAVVRVTDGSLAAIRRLSRVQIACEAPAAVSDRSLRVGVPATPDSLPGYLRGASDGGDTRWTRLTDMGSGPDTVVTRRFSDPADREIALERGELDAALFGAGEMSARLQADRRWTWSAAPDGGALVYTPAAEPVVRALGARQLARLRGTP